MKTPAKVVVFLHSGGSASRIDWLRIETRVSDTQHDVQHPAARNLSPPETVRIEGAPRVKLVQMVRVFSRIDWTSPFEEFD